MGREDRAAGYLRVVRDDDVPLPSLDADTTAGSKLAKGTSADREYVLEERAGGRAAAGGGGSTRRSIPRSSAAVAQQELGTLTRAGVSLPSGCRGRRKTSMARSWRAGEAKRQTCIGDVASRNSRKASERCRRHRGGRQSHCGRAPHALWVCFRALPQWPGMMRVGRSDYSCKRGRTARRDGAA